jgi:hypothetical protein
MTAAGFFFHLIDVPRPAAGQARIPASLRGGPSRRATATSTFWSTTSARRCSDRRSRPRGRVRRDVGGQRQGPVLPRVLTGLGRARWNHVQGTVVVADWGGASTGPDAAQVLAASSADITLVSSSTVAGEGLHQYLRNADLGLHQAGVHLVPHLGLEAVGGDTPSGTSSQLPSRRHLLRMPS